jgi:hypothetical protein
MKDDLVHTGHRWKNNIKMYTKMGMGVEIEFIHFRMGTTKVIFEHDSEPSYTRISDGEINLPAEWALAFQKGHCLQCCRYNHTHTQFEASNY